MPTADATLLPPPFSSSSSTAPDLRAEELSSRHLEDVGVETVLEAMVEQKRRSSQPSFPAHAELEPSERRMRPPTTSDVFLKAR